MQSNTTVTDLDLEDNSLDVKGTIFMCDMLKENCYITDLVSEVTVEIFHNSFIEFNEFIELGLWRCVLEASRSP